MWNPSPARNASTETVKKYNAKLAKWLEANPQVPSFVKRAIQSHRGDHVPVSDMDTSHPIVETWTPDITIKWEGENCNPI